MNDGILYLQCKRNYEDRGIHIPSCGMGHCTHLIAHMVVWIVMPVRDPQLLYIQVPNRNNNIMLTSNTNSIRKKENPVHLSSGSTANSDLVDTH